MLAFNPDVHEFCTSCLHVHPYRVLGFVGLTAARSSDGLQLATLLSKRTPGSAADLVHAEACLNLLSLSIANVQGLVKVIPQLLSSKLEQCVVVTLCDLFTNLYFGAPNILVKLTELTSSFLSAPQSSASGPVSIKIQMIPQVSTF